MFKPLIYLFLAAFFLIIQSPAANCAGDLNVDVEIETGPEFNPADAPTVWACVQAHYHKKFPFDFYTAPPLTGNLSCPGAEFFGEYQEACWVIEVWHKVEPGFLLASFILAILWL